MTSLTDLTLDFHDASESDGMDRCKHVSSYIVAPNLKPLDVSIPLDLFPALNFGISLSSILPDPTKLTDLRIIYLRGVKNKVRNDHTHRTVDNSVWFRDLANTNSVQDLFLLGSSGEVLGIDTQLSPNGSVSRTDDSQQFMNVKSITLNSVLPEDVLWLCRVVSARPSIRRLRLIGAKQAFEQDVIHLVVTPDGVFDPKELGRYESGEVLSVGVEEWLRERVDFVD
ncbi:hypothetical protein L218DRAFT_1006454 [Marasmius fiardii PR-910]|nr:hypothetical protein L218DRAFT_1006454 [Marasmius fiardii PR-910]